MECRSSSAHKRMTPHRISMRSPAIAQRRNTSATVWLPTPKRLFDFAHHVPPGQPQVLPFGRPHLCQLASAIGAVAPNCDALEQPADPSRGLSERRVTFGMVGLLGHLQECIRVFGRRQTRRSHRQMSRVGPDQSWGARKDGVRRTISGKNACKPNALSDSRSPRDVHSLATSNHGAALTADFGLQ